MTTTHESYEPGNGTRYDLFLNKANPSLYVFAWLNAPGGGRSMYLNPGACAYMSYVAEKLHHGNEADLTAILRWLATHDVPVHVE